MATNLSDKNSLTLYRVAHVVQNIQILKIDPADARKGNFLCEIHVV